MAEITYIPIDHLRPHPLNPRKDLGDLTELAESIKGNGILQNLTVVPIACVPKLTGRDYGVADPDDDDLYVVVIGHRRLAAATMAGEDTVPCSIVAMSQGQQQETMLIENMQRSDLTVYEQAQGFQMMLDMGHSVQTIVNRTGFSETTVRRRLKMAELDQEKLKEVSTRQISLMDFDRLSQIEDLAQRNECLDKIGTGDFDMAVQRAVQKQAVDRNMPKVKEWLKKIRAKKLKDSERWSSKYDQIGGTIYLEKWGEPDNLPKEGVAEKPVFYWLGSSSYDYNKLCLYHEREKAPPVRRSPEEIERDKAVKAAWDRIESTASDAYSLRKKFIEDFKVTRKNEHQVLYGAVLAGCFNAISYNSSDRTMLYRLAGITDTGYIPDREEQFFTGLKKMPGEDMAKLVYALFGDGQISCGWGAKANFPAFQQNRKLELIYRWFSLLGYEMSTDEARLLKADSDLYGRSDDDGEM